MIRGWLVISFAFIVHKHAYTHSREEAPPYPMPPMHITEVRVQGSITRAERQQRRSTHEWVVQTFQETAQRLLALSQDRGRTYQERQRAQLAYNQLMRRGILALDNARQQYDDISS